MANEGKGKGLFGSLQGIVDSAKTAVQDMKLPEINIPDKLPEIKIPEVNISKIFQGKENSSEVPVLQRQIEISSISIPSALQIIYFMMHADGAISNDEEEKFDAIGKELDPIFLSIKEKIVSSCAQHLGNLINPEDYYDAVQDGVKEAIDAGANQKGTAITPKLLVWDLMTIAYSDGGYDENERRLLKYIVRKLHVDKAVFLEMESSLLTIHDLENEMAWIKNSGRPFLTVSAIVNEITARKDAVFQSVKDLIAL